MEHPVKKIDVHEIPAVISDSEKVSLGAVSPAFPPTRGTPTKISDTGKVRIGDFSPAFPPLRSK
jgi:hypothetical protein